jgi:hypothetical protein
METSRRRAVDNEPLVLRDLVIEQAACRIRLVRVPVDALDARSPGLFIDARIKALPMPRPRWSGSVKRSCK